jgi:hypothetical protein
MRVDRWRKACVGVVLVVTAACAGCAGHTDGTPKPQAAESTIEPSYEEPAPGGTGQEAPRVENPLDATRYLSQPCAAVTPGQLSAFDVDRPGVPTTTGAVAEQAGPYCSWRFPVGTTSRGSLGIGFLSGNEGGLSDFYRTQDEFAYFEPTTIHGYPAVFADRQDLRADGECNVVVGINDSLAFHGWEAHRNPEGACDRAEKLAAAALATMRGGA